MSVLREYPATSTHSRFGQRGPGRAVPSLSSLPCWVVPPSKASSPAGGPARFCCLHSKVRQLAALACLGLMTAAAPGEPAPALRRCTSIRGAVPVRGEGCAPLGRWCALTLLGRPGPGPGGRLPSHIVGLFRCSREPKVSLPRRSRARRPPARFRRPPPEPRSTRCARSAPLVTGRLVAGARNPAAQDPAVNETPSNQG